MSSSLSHLRKSDKLSKIKAITLAAAFVLIGFTALRISHAATFTKASEAEDGAVAGNAASTDDAAASGLKDVKFGSGGTAATTQRVMFIFMENKSYHDVIGNSSAPYINSLAKNFENATNAYGVGHDSLDNYLAFVSGNFYQWSVSNCDPGPGCQSTDPTIAEQLDGKSILWASYTEGMPGPCSFVQTPHVNIPPFLWFPNVVKNDCNKIVGDTNLISDLNSATPPVFSILVPNQCNNMSTDEPCGTIPAGDAYLSKEIPAIQATKWYKDGGTIVLTYDEGDRSGQGGLQEYLTGEGNHIPTILISNAHAGKPEYTPYVNLYGMLAGAEKLFGVPCLGKACDSKNGLLPLP